MPFSPGLAERGYGGVGGHKVGLVTPEIRASATGGDTDELGWDTPVYSGLIGSRIFRDSAVVPFGECIRPRIEGEFAVRIGADIPPEKAPFTRESIGDYVEACMAGIEIVDWRMWYWDFDRPLGPLMLADICSNWGAIFSDGVTDWRSLDIPALGATLTCNGETVSSGKASAPARPSVRGAGLAGQSHGGTRPLDPPRRGNSSRLRDGELCRFRAGRRAHRRVGRDRRGTRQVHLTNTQGDMQIVTIPGGQT